MIYRSEDHECRECPCSYLDHPDLWCEHYALAEKLTNAKNSEPICPDTGIRPDCPLPVVNAKSVEVIKARIAELENDVEWDAEEELDGLRFALRAMGVEEG